MENEIQRITSSVQPLPKTPTSISTLPSTSWSKILLFTVVGLIIVIGTLFVGIQIGKNLTPNQQPIVAQPSTPLTQTVVNPAQPTTNPITVSTTDWKTHTNKYFTIKYPSLLNTTPWSIKQASDKSHVNLSENFKSLMGLEPPAILDYSRLSSDDIEIDLVIFENMNNYSVTQWYDMYVFYPDSYGVPVDKESFKKTIYIDGNIAGMGNSADMFYSIGVLVPNENIMVLIHTQYKNNSENYRQLVNQILSTLKFNN